MGLGLGVVLLSSCTANFCTVDDLGEMLYPYEQGVTVYCSQDEYNSYLQSDEYVALADTAGAQEIADALSGPLFTDSEGNAIGNVYKYVPFTASGTSYTFTAAKSSRVNSIVSSITSSNYYVAPSIQFWAKIDQLTVEASVYSAYALDNSDSTATIATYGELSEAERMTVFSEVLAKEDGLEFVSSITLNDASDNKWCINPYVESDTDGSGDVTAIPLSDDGVTGNSILRKFGGSTKFYRLCDANWLEESVYAGWVRQLRTSTETGLGVDGVLNSDSLSLYRSNAYSAVSSQTSCITTTSDTFGHYGSASDWEVAIEAKDWSYAWDRGFLEGLIVYPVTVMLDTFARGMDPALSGVGQIWAIIFVALIVRIILAAVMLPSTLSQQKMQALQPQLAKIQAKYPNANTNQAEKMRLAQEQQALYKRNNVHMFLPFLAMFIQFPIFICVWSGMRGSAALSTGSFLGLSLSDTVSSVLFNFSSAWYANANGWWTALVIVILMAGSQLAAILVPQMLTKRRNAKYSIKTSKNPNQTKQANTMKYMTWIMYAITVFMGFTLPSAMAVYWIIGAIVGLGQSLLVHYISGRQMKKKGNKKQ